MQNGLNDINPDKEEMVSTISLKRKNTVCLSIIGIIFLLIGLYHLTKPFMLSAPSDEEICAFIDEYNHSEEQRTHNNTHKLKPYTSYEIRSKSFNLFNQTAYITIDAEIAAPFFIEKHTLKLEIQYKNGWALANNISDSITDTEIDYLYSTGSFTTIDDVWGRAVKTTLYISDIDTARNTITLDCKRYYPNKILELSGEYPFEYLKYDDGCNYYLISYLDGNWKISIHSASIYLEVNSLCAIYSEADQSTLIKKYFEQ